MWKVTAVRLDQEQIKTINNSCLRLLPESRRSRLRRFVHDIDCTRSLIGELEVRREACNQFNLGNCDLVFRADDHGKPRIANLPNFHFNISHSGNWVVVGFSTSAIGVDVERLGPVDLSIAGKCFTLEEISYVGGGSGAVLPSDQAKKTLEIWTLKESYAKALGWGLLIPTRSYSVRKGNPWSRVSINGVSTCHTLWTGYLDEMHCYSVCSEGSLTEPALDAFTADAKIWENSLEQVD
jgi:4'-phosphopantetheinyl transferase